MRLVHALIAKSLAETVLVATLAVSFYLSAFPPYFHGWGEITPGGVSGWVIDQSSPERQVEVQLFIDEQFVATAVANLPRPDVVSAGWAKEEFHGYNFLLPTLGAGVHEARVYALHASGHGLRRTLQLLGDPLRFRVDQDGKITALESEP